MPVLSDKWIKKTAQTKGMIKPFVSKQVRKGKISFGLSSYGYDARVSSLPECWLEMTKSQRTTYTKNKRLELQALEIRSK